MGQGTLAILPGGEASGSYLAHCFFSLPGGPYPAHVFFLTLLGSAGPGRYPILFVVKFRVECNSNHVWGSPGARDMTIFVTTSIFIEIIRAISIDDDLFSGYRVEADLFLGYQRRK